MSFFHGSGRRRDKKYAGGIFLPAARQLPGERKRQRPQAAGNNECSTAIKIKRRPKGGVSFLAAGEGFEPSHTESESAVLPLHNPAVSLTNATYYTVFSTFVKYFFRFFYRRSSPRKYFPKGRCSRAKAARVIPTLGTM